MAFQNFDIIKKLSCQIFKSDNNPPNLIDLTRCETEWQIGVETLIEKQIHITITGMFLNNFLNYQQFTF